MQQLYFLILAIILFFSPYARGLYFNEDFYSIGFILSLLTIVFIIRIFLYKEIDILKSVIIILLLPFFRYLSLIVAESPMGTWNEIIRWTSYSSFLLLLFWASQKKGIKKWMPVVFQFTGIGIAIFMMVAFFGWVSIKDAIVANRFAGVFQYPNTFGLVMAIFYFFSLAMLLKDRITTWSIFLYATPLVLFLLNLLQSYSRGVWLLFPIIWFIGLFFYSIKNQFEYILYTLISAVCSLIVFAAFSQGVGNKGIILLVGSLLITTGIIYFLKTYGEKFFDRWIAKLESFKFSRSYLPIIIFLLSIGLVLDLLNNGLVAQMLPARMRERLTNIDLSASTATERFIFLKDAFKMSGDSPILGFGGEAWATLYPAYQTTPYISNKIHNGYAEWLVEMGWLGLIIYLLVFGYFLYRIFQSARKEKDSLYVGILLALMLIFSHSFIDFNFSFGALWFMIMWLFVMGISEQNSAFHWQPKGSWWKYAPNIFVIGMLLVILSGAFFSYRFMAAARSYDNLKQNQSLQAKIQLLEKATKMNPYNTEYIYELADSYINKLNNKEDIQLSLEVEELATRLRNLEPRNPSVLNEVGLLYLELGEPEVAIQYFDQALNFDRYNMVFYKNSLHVKTELAKNFMKNNPEKAKQLAFSAVNTFQQMNELESEFLKMDLDEAFNSKNFTISPEMKYYGSLAQFLAGNYSEVIELYKNSQLEQEDKPYIDRIHAIAYLTYKQMGIEEEASTIFNNFFNKEFEDTKRDLEEKLQ